MLNMVYQGTVWGPPLWNVFYADAKASVNMEQGPGQVIIVTIDPGPRQEAFLQRIWKADWIDYFL